LKTLYGACIASQSDDRESVAINRLGDDMDHPSHLPKSELLRIIRPRVEEILELVRDRLRASGHAAQAGRRLVMTGGACQLTGLPEFARSVISNQARIGRPLGIEGLPESGKNPSFAAAVGLLVYPQMAGLEFFEPTRSVMPHAHVEGGYAARVGRWLKASF
ncbi:MAG: cell division FtsA domain-containing protein, partial [Roseiarcus sp.]